MLSLLLAAALPAAVRGEGMKVTLRFMPQESTHASTPDLPAALLNMPVDVVFEDGRPAADKDRIGEVLDDDKSSPITASDVAGFAKKVLADSVSGWGVKVTPGADRVLTVKLVRFFVSENPKAIGAMFGSEVRALVSYAERRKVLWEGTATGTTHRYGKRNEENVNEVLSDALKEAYANALSDPGLQQALSGHGQPVAAAGSARAGSAASAAAEGVAPGQLLTELRDLKKQGFSTDLLVQYVNQKTLSSEMTAKDLGAWKQAGMPPEVIKAALGRSPGAAKP
ncbi:MAG TPA: hypothetical protein VGR07_18400 [Thermoanaerobaculia bacterium]|jgi:hypothetical protein|nr:hypothetical protein [Thermoanaerobaculia bacterium]